MKLENTKLNVLLLVDYQVDFVTGSLGTDRAKEIELFIHSKLAEDYDLILITKDTHYEDTYAQTTEGKALPAHVIKGTPGHDLYNEAKIMEIVGDRALIVEKETFGSTELLDELALITEGFKQEDMTFEYMGVCTDICVVSNFALVKAVYPDANFVVHEKGCGGVTKETHDAALTVLKSMLVDVQ